MFSKINSICLRGMEGKNVAVEADVSDGLPGLILVGYLASEVREGGDRVRTAIRNLGLSLPPKKITINLSPADFRKEGTGFDLAIAAAILSAHGGFSAKDLEDAVFFWRTRSGRSCPGDPRGYGTYRAGTGKRFQAGIFTCGECK